ncbi:hypothetical protein [Phocoenobacter skyensis]|uniref:HicA toxin of toxin-antitoxin n=1 Tax=Phocoenobacter skyensis TaxID=97481 RepID=A0A1H7Z4I9_9PAST|nr:hypothetical protein [Pasteurella skyensis]MDP8080172.1 hypothetical protein [Pasteurella skyensis]MDP8086136.1 hypothetical protein [Pasteurella skyensis]MDP8185890.1 hypothetical protein [Pasteurella skyensis]QLB22953.1 hypothetical protein A6B44_06940 [Pasteurella skyensis]SEM52468.1 hypothetical protein SAMN05444853_1228 [Pasteurella skyensis]
MLKVSNEKDISKLIKKLIKYSNVQIKKGKKHHFITQGRKKIPIPSSPSDRNSVKQLKRDIQKYFFIGE